MILEGSEDASVHLGFLGEAKMVQKNEVYEGHQSEESRASLFNCLEREEVKYQIDEKNNILIKHKDADTAVARCV
ncbi:hypothetical protein [Sporosarcina sp. ZBG7A]|uniref:hypothetical protein n=1 Tax=Sporosarcina sp. ZBG7A TaxID=1582223 RepID=UPI00057ACBCD|nr:hypothetical protein [Sporosarcina sp. ZBG7A]